MAEKNMVIKRFLIIILVISVVLCSAGIAFAAEDSSYDGSDPVVSISLGANYSAAILADGSLWTWGDNDLGKLGDGTTEGSCVPVKVMDDVASVCLGRGHSAAIKTDGSLWMWGYNIYGQLGNDDIESGRAPIKVMDDVASVSLGGDGYTAVLKTDGTLWMCGYNRNGQLSSNFSGNTYNPQQIMTDVASISMGEAHCAAIKTDGSLWMWGFSSNGELADGVTGRYALGANPYPEKVMDDVRSVSLGCGRSAAIKNDGSLWTWGANYSGELGDGTTNDSNVPIKIMDDVVSVDMGYTSAAIKNDGSLWTWGDNEYGQLGDGTYESRCVPVKIMDDVVSVSMGSYQNGALKADGSLWMWGENEYGEVGDGTFTNRNLPVRITIPWMGTGTEEETASPGLTEDEPAISGLTPDDFLGSYMDMNPASIIPGMSNPELMDLYYDENGILTGYSRMSYGSTGTTFYFPYTEWEINGDRITLYYEEIDNPYYGADYTAGSHTFSRTEEGLLQTADNGFEHTWYRVEN